MRSAVRSACRLFLLSLAVFALTGPERVLAQDHARAGNRVPAEQLAALAHAQAGVASPVGSSGDISILNLGPCDALPLRGTLNFDVSFCTKLTPTDAEADVGFPVHLPTGALIRSISLRYSDVSENDDPLATLSVAFSGTVGLVQEFSPDAFSGGDRTFVVNLDPPYQVDNLLSTFITLYLFPDQTFYSIQIGYQLQVSPAPVAATFGDVPTDHPFFQYVEALAASGITGGCGGGNYCPDQALTRGQMAVFLAKALGLHFPN